MPTPSTSSKGEIWTVKRRIRLRISMLKPIAPAVGDCYATEMSHALVVKTPPCSARVAPTIMNETRTPLADTPRLYTFARGATRVVDAFESGGTKLQARGHCTAEPANGFSPTTKFSNMLQPLIGSLLTFGVLSIDLQVAEKSGLRKLISQVRGFWRCRMNLKSG